LVFRNDKARWRPNTALTPHDYTTAQLVSLSYVFMCKLLSRARVVVEGVCMLSWSKAFCVSMGLIAENVTTLKFRAADKLWKKVLSWEGTGPVFVFPFDVSSGRVCSSGRWLKPVHNTCGGYWHTPHTCFSESLVYVSRLWCNNVLPWHTHHAQQQWHGSCFQNTPFLCCALHWPHVVVDSQWCCRRSPSCAAVDFLFKRMWMTPCVCYDV